MNAHLGLMYAEKIMDLDKYEEGINSKAYENFYFRYMRIQFYINFITNIQSKMEYEHEMETDFNWDKQYNDELFQVGYKNNPFNLQAMGDLEIVKNVRETVKKKMNLSKDYYYINEELALHEFLQLFSVLEYYLQDLYREIIDADPNKFLKKLRISTVDEKLILEKLACGEELSEKIRKEVFENSISNYLMKNVIEFIDNILKSLPKKEVEKFKIDIEYDEFITFLNEMKELRNLHTHKLGMKDGKYENVFGMYKTDALCGSLYHLVPKLDRLVVENILLPKWKRREC